MSTNEHGYSGFIVQSPLISPTYAADLADPTPQAGPKPGLARPDQSGTECTVVTGGTQGDDVVTVAILRGGFKPAATAAWKHDTMLAAELPGDYIGWNAPNFAQDVRNSAGDDGEFISKVGSATTSTGRVVVAGVYSTALIGAAKTAFVTYTDDNITWVGYDISIPLISDNTASPVYYGGYTVDDFQAACIDYDADRSVLQVWIRVVEDLEGNRQFWLFESDDNGATWTIAQKDCLRRPWAPADDCALPTVGRIGGAVVLINPHDDGATYSVAQWYSLDGGRTFELADDDDPFGTGQAAYSYRLCTHEGTLRAYYIDDVEGELCYSVMTSAQEWIGNLDERIVTGFSGTSEFDVISAFGRVWIVYVDADQLVIRLACATRPDEFAVAYGNFTPFGHEVYDIQSNAITAPTITVDSLSLAVQNGGFLCQFKTSGTDSDANTRQRLMSLRMGGWSSVTLPQTQVYADTPGRVAFGGNNVSTSGFFDVDGFSYYPLLAPSASGWSESVLGTGGTITVDCDAGGSPYLQFNCPAIGDSAFIDTTMSTSVDLEKGILVYFDMEQVTGGSAVASDSLIYVDIGDGTRRYTVELRFGAASGTRIIDVLSGTLTATSFVAGSRSQCLLAFRSTDSTSNNTGVVSLYYAAWSAFDGRMVWKLAASTTMTSMLSAVNVFLLTAGQLSVAAAARSKWYAVHAIAISGYPGQSDLASGFDETMLGGFPISAYPARIPGGTTLAFAGGPARTSDTYTIAPKYSYALEHIYPQLYPCPRVSWRTVDTADQVVLQWDVDSVTATRSGFGAATWGLAFIKTNIRLAALEVYDGADWLLVMDIDNSAEFSDLPARMAFDGTNSGAYITVDMDGTGNADRYIHENEFAGGTALVEGVPVRITSNTSGYWSPVAGKKPVLFINFEDWDVSIPEVGSITIIPPCAVHLAHGLGILEFQKLRLRIPDPQETPQGYFEAGNIVIGPAYVFGRRYGFGRVTSQSSGTVVTTSATGVKSSVVMSPTQRTAKFAWVDGFDTTDLYDLANGEPTFVTIGTAATEAAAVATRAATHTDLAGLLDRIDGPHLPVVLVNAINYDATAGAPFELPDHPAVQQMLTDKHSFLYGRVVGDLVINNVKGHEQTNEVVTIAEMTVVEEV